MRTAVAALIVSACSFSPKPAGDQPTTDGGGSLDGANAADAESPGSGGTAPTCATPGSIQDSFTGTQLSTQWTSFTVAGATVGVNGNNLQLQIGPGPTSYASVTSRHAVDLTDGAAEVEVTSVLGSGATTFSAGVDYGHYAAFNEENSILAFKLVVDETITGTTIPFDAVNMKYWQFHQVGNSLAFETSPNGSGWTSQFSIATPTWIDTAFVTLSAGGASGTAQLTNLDELQPSAPWCSVDSLHDKFPTGDEQWAATPFSQHCVYTYSAGATLTQSTAGTCAFGTSYAWDFTNAGLVVKWGAINPAASSTFEPTIAIQGDASPLFDITTSNSQVCVPGMCVGHPFQPSGSDAYWQLAESGGNIAVSASPDGSSWSQIVSVPDPFTPVLGEIELGATTTDSTADTVTFESVN